MVIYERASTVWDNLRKEAPAYEMNETLWSAVDKVVLTQTNFADCYRELAETLDIPGEYGTRSGRQCQYGPTSPRCDARHHPSAAVAA
jgi:hypothetical protein